MAFTKITNADLTDKGVIGLPDTPNLSTSAMQEKFEETARSVIIPKHNALIDELESISGASSIGTANSNVQTDIDNLTRKLKIASDDASAALSDITQVKNDVNTLTTDNTSNKARISSLETDNTSNKTRISALETDNTSNKSRISSLETDNVKNKSDISTMQATLLSVDAVKHSHTNKVVLDKLSEDSTSGDLTFNGSKIKNDTFGKVKVGTDFIAASGNDTIELIAGANIKLTPSKTNKTVVIDSTGGGSGGGGDMFKSEFVLSGGTGKVLRASEADHATNADKATNSDTVGTATTSVLEKLSDDNGKLLYDGKPLDVAVDNFTIVKNATTGALEVPINSRDFEVDTTTNQLQLSSTTTTKLANFDENGNVVNNPNATTNNLYNELSELKLNNANRNLVSDITYTSVSSAGAYAVKLNNGFNFKKGMKYRVSIQTQNTGAVLVFKGWQYVKESPSGAHYVNCHGNRVTKVWTFTEDYFVKDFLNDNDATQTGLCSNLQIEYDTGKDTDYVESNGLSNIELTNELAPLEIGLTGANISDSSGRTRLIKVGNMCILHIAGSASCNLSASGALVLFPSEYAPKSTIFNVGRKYSSNGGVSVAFLEVSNDGKALTQTELSTGDWIYAEFVWAINK